MGYIINNFPEQSIPTHNFQTSQWQQLVNCEKPSTNLILGSSAQVDLALVCNPKGQRSH